MQKNELNQIDPLKRQPDQGVVGESLSPMGPPEAFAPPAADRVPREEMHPFLQQFMQEHDEFMNEIKIFEDAILEVQASGFTKELQKKLSHFFHFFDNDFVIHSRREEATFFPLLSRRLKEKGEHTKGDSPKTAVDLMEDDHIKAIQMAAVIFNFLGLAFRLPDGASRLIVLDAALEQGKNLVELLRLHIFREDNIVFSSAHRLISASELSAMANKTC